MFLLISAPQSLDSSQSNLDEQRLYTRLLEHAVVALPNLRYVALGRIPLDLAEEPGEHTEWRWWRIIRTMGNVEVREVPAWEGERVRKYMHNADIARADNFDGKLLSIFVLSGPLMPASLRL